MSMLKDSLLLLEAIWQFWTGFPQQILGRFVWRAPIRLDMQQVEQYWSYWNYLWFTPNKVEDCNKICFYVKFNTLLIYIVKCYQNTVSVQQLACIYWDDYVEYWFWVAIHISPGWSALVYLDDLHILCHPSPWKCITMSWPSKHKIKYTCCVQIKTGSFFVYLFNKQYG